MGQDPDVSRDEELHWLQTVHRQVNKSHPSQRGTQTKIKTPVYPKQAGDGISSPQLVNSSSLPRVKCYSGRSKRAQLRQHQSSRDSITTSPW